MLYTVLAMRYVIYGTGDMLYLCSRRYVIYGTMRYVIYGTMRYVIYGTRRYVIYGTSVCVYGTGEEREVSQMVPITKT